MKKEQKIAILILAAGSSSRMGGQIKQLLSWKDSTLLENAINQANKTTADAIFVVLGAFEDEIRTKIELNTAEAISNTNWKNGLGSSIAAGILHFSKHALAYDGVCIMLADQPFMDTEYLNSMLKIWKNNTTKIITTKYTNHSGVPAIFGKEHFINLEKLNKDFGAKDIIKLHKNVILDLNPNGKQIDVDNWEAYQKLITENN